MAPLISMSGMIAASIGHILASRAGAGRIRGYGEPPDHRRGHGSNFTPVGLLLVVYVLSQFRAGYGIFDPGESIAGDAREWRFDVSRAVGEPL